MSMFSLAGKSAIITGAASGIGRASAILFAQAGASVLVCDRAAAVEATAEAIRAAGGTASAMEMDAGSGADVRAAVAEAVARFGRLDIAYANAGITGGLPEFFETTEETWTDVLRVNLIGPFLLIKHAAPEIMKAGGGSIVCTASVAGLRHGAGPVAYSASKAGVINLVQHACQSLIGTNVRVNAICPGLTETGMTKPLYDQVRAAGREDRIGQLNPLQRGGEPEEIAAMALFLASPASSYVNGQAIPVDGGLSTSHPVSPATQKASRMALDALKDD